MIVAIDYGERKVGIAISDESETFAFPKFVVERELFEANPRILEGRLENFELVTEIIIGLPKNLKGINTIQTEKVMVFFEMVKYTYPDKRVILFDERFTSKIFEKCLKIHGRSPRSFKKTKDMYEACIILEDYLQGKKNETAE